LSREILLRFKLSPAYIDETVNERTNIYEITKIKHKHPGKAKLGEAPCPRAANSMLRLMAQKFRP